MKITIEYRGNHTDRIVITKWPENIYRKEIKLEQKSKVTLIAALGYLLFLRGLSVGEERKAPIDFIANRRRLLSDERFENDVLRSYFGNDECGNFEDGDELLRERIKRAFNFWDRQIGARFSGKTLELCGWDENSLWLKSLYINLEKERNRFNGTVYFSPEEPIEVEWANGLPTYPKDAKENENRFAYLCSLDWAGKDRKTREASQEVVPVTPYLESASFRVSETVERVQTDYRHIDRSLLPPVVHYDAERDRKERKRSIEECAGELLKARFTIIEGDAGAGKTIACHYLLKEAVSRHLMPIYIQAYQARKEGTDLFNYIGIHYTDGKEYDPETRAAELLEKYEALVILDGLDEVLTKTQKRLMFDIEEMLDEKRFDKAHIILVTRNAGSILQYHHSCVEPDVLSLLPLQLTESAKLGRIYGKYLAPAFVNKYGSILNRPLIASQLLSLDGDVDHDRLNQYGHKTHNDHANQINNLYGLFAMGMRFRESHAREHGGHPILYRYILPLLANTIRENGENRDRQFNQDTIAHMLERAESAGLKKKMDREDRGLFREKKDLRKALLGSGLVRATGGEDMEFAHSELFSFYAANGAILFAKENEMALSEILDNAIRKTDSKDTERLEKMAFLPYAYYLAEAIRSELKIQKISPENQAKWFMLSLNIGYEKVYDIYSPEMNQMLKEYETDCLMTSPKDQDPWFPYYIYHHYMRRINSALCTMLPLKTFGDREKNDQVNTTISCYESLLFLEEKEVAKCLGMNIKGWRRADVFSPFDAICKQIEKTERTDLPRPREDGSEYVIAILLANLAASHLEKTKLLKQNGNMKAAITELNQAGAAYENALRYRKLDHHGDGGDPRKARLYVALGTVARLKTDYLIETESCSASCEDGYLQAVESYRAALNELGLRACAQEVIALQKKRPLCGPFPLYHALMRKDLSKTPEENMRMEPEDGEPWVILTRIAIAYNNDWRNRNDDLHADELFTCLKAGALLLEERVNAEPDAIRRSARVNLNWQEICRMEEVLDVCWENHAAEGYFERSPEKKAAMEDIRIILDRLKKQL